MDQAVQDNRLKQAETPFAPFKSEQEQIRWVQENVGLGLNCDYVTLGRIIAGPSHLPHKDSGELIAYISNAWQETVDRALHEVREKGEIPTMDQGKH